MEEVIVMYAQCERCGEKGYHVEENRRQGVIKDRQKWYGYQKKEKKKVACPTEGKAQQSGARPRELESIAKEGGSQREVKRTFKMLREVWISIRVEKLNTHKGITVKVFLDSSITRMFIDKRMAARHGFKLQKLERPIIVRNVNGTNNSGGAIIHQIKVNIYYKGHVERIRMDVCDLGKTEIILGISWLVAHNPKIN